MLTTLSGSTTDGLVRTLIKRLSSPIMMVSNISPIHQITVPLTCPAWDGYQANRRRLLQHIYDNSIDNVVAVTGDTHANWLFENNLETTLQGGNDSTTVKDISTTGNTYQRGTVVEFGGTAVSSNGWGNSWGSYDNATIGATRMVQNNPSLLYSEGWCE
jgi:alkaline phosphatase D